MTFIKTLRRLALIPLLILAGGQAYGQTTRITSPGTPAGQINIETGPLTVSPAEQDWQSAQWVFQPVVGPNSFLIANVWKRTYLAYKDQQLYFQVLDVPASSTDPAPERWALEKVNCSGKQNEYRIHPVSKPELAIQITLVDNQVRLGLYGGSPCKGAGSVSFDYWLLEGTIPSLAGGQTPPQGGGQTPTYNQKPVRFTTVDAPSRQMNIERGFVEASTVPQTFLSSQWALEPIPGTYKAKFKNVWTGSYLTWDPKLTPSDLFVRVLTVSPSTSQPGKWHVDQDANPASVSDLVPETWIIEPVPNTGPDPTTMQYIIRPSSRTTAQLYLADTGSGGFRLSIYQDDSRPQKWLISGYKSPELPPNRRN